MTGEDAKESWTPFVIPWTWYTAKRIVWRCPQPCRVYCLVDGVLQRARPIPGTIHRSASLGFVVELNHMPQAQPFLGLHLKDIAWKEGQITFSLITGPCTCQRHPPDTNSGTLRQGAHVGASSAAGANGGGEGAGGGGSGTATGLGNGTSSGSGSGAEPDGGQAQAQAREGQVAGGGPAAVPSQGAGGAGGCMGGQDRTGGEDGRGGLRRVGAKRKEREGKAVGGGVSSGSGAAGGGGGKVGQRGGVSNGHGMSASAGAQNGVPGNGGRGVADDPEPQSDEEEAEDGSGRGRSRTGAGGAGAATAWCKGHHNHWLKHLPPQEVWDARRAAIAERDAGSGAANPACTAPLDFGPPPPRQLRCRCPCHNGPHTWVRTYCKNGEEGEEEEEEEEEESQGPQRDKAKGGRAARRAEDASSRPASAAAAADASSDTDDAEQEGPARSGPGRRPAGCGPRARGHAQGRPPRPRTAAPHPRTLAGACGSAHGGLGKPPRGGARLEGAASLLFECGSRCLRPTRSAEVCLPGRVAEVLRGHIPEAVPRIGAPAPAGVQVVAEVDGVMQQQLHTVRIATAGVNSMGKPHYRLKPAPPGAHGLMCVGWGLVRRRGGVLLVMRVKAVEEGSGGGEEGSQREGEGEGEEEEEGEDEEDSDVEEGEEDVEMEDAAEDDG